jgi:hypothetical protein
MARDGIFLSLIGIAAAAVAVIAADGSGGGQVEGAQRVDAARPAAVAAAGCAAYPAGWSIASATASGRMDLAGPNGERISIEPESSYDGVALVSASPSGVALGAPFLHASGATVRQSAARDVTVAIFPAIDGMSGLVYSMADADAGCLAGNLDRMLQGFAGYPPLGAQPW